MKIIHYIRHKCKKKTPQQQIFGLVVCGRFEPSFWQDTCFQNSRWLFRSHCSTFLHSSCGPSGGRQDTCRHSHTRGRGGKAFKVKVKIQSNDWEWLVKHYQRLELLYLFIYFTQSTRRFCVQIILLFRSKIKSELPPKARRAYILAIMKQE